MRPARIFFLFNCQTPVFCLLFLHKGPDLIRKILLVTGDEGQPGPCAKGHKQLLQLWNPHGLLYKCIFVFHVLSTDLVSLYFCITDFIYYYFIINPAQ